MIALLWFALAILALPFKSKNRLEAENAALKRRLIALRRNVHGRVRLCVPKTGLRNDLALAELHHQYVRM